MHRPVHCFTLLPRAGEAESCFSGSPRSWLPAPAEPVGDQWHVGLDVTGLLPQSLARVPVMATVGPILREDHRLVRPISWRVLPGTPPPARLPGVHGELDLRPLGAGGARLSLLGRWRVTDGPMSVDGDLAVSVCVWRLLVETADRLAAGAAAAVLPAAG